MISVARATLATDLIPITYRRRLPLSLYMMNWRGLGIVLIYIIYGRAKKRDFIRRGLKCANYFLKLRYDIL